MPNPFAASFGVSPPLLVGRDSLLEEFTEALDDGPGAAGRATLFTGARGSGKTVMLNAVEDRARERGWLVISETASAGFAQRIATQHLPRLLRDFVPKAINRHVTGLTAPANLGSVEWDTIERHVVAAGLRNQLEPLTDLLRPHETGVLVTLDEIHAGQVNDSVLTFLRRAERHALGAVSRDDVQRGFREPIEAGGRTVGEEALEIMVDGSHGYRSSSNSSAPRVGASTPRPQRSRRMPRCAALRPPAAAWALS